MAKALKTVGTVLGAVALVATGVGAIGGIALASSIGAIAGVAAGVANLGAQALAKPPPARGSVTQMIVDPNAATPYVMGEGYFAGVLRHRTAYGGTVDGVPNPRLFDAVVYTAGGPATLIEPRIDYEAIPSWFNGFLFTDTQLGQTPAPAALAPHWPGAPGWSAAHKLSGLAGIGWSLNFDKKGKRFASGLPLTGAFGQWVKVYDPRRDDTFPGGEGPHRLGVESTYEYSDSPALHAGTYAFGRYQNGKRVLGCGIPREGIDWRQVADWANVCEANGWTMFGVVFEPGDRWANLKDICAAGGCEPVPGAVLGFHYQAPRVALDTIGEADIADADMSVVAMQSYRDRINTVLPKYRSPEHNWELVQAEPVSVPAWVVEDGEERAAEWPFNFVKEVDQATQLATYKAWDTREIYPLELPCGPRLRGYRPGDCLHVDLPELDLDQDAIILTRDFDPASMTVSFTLVSETHAKHAFALGRTGIAPPTPALGQSVQERDETASSNAAPSTYEQGLIANSTASGLMVTASETELVIGAHARVYLDKSVPVGGTTLTQDAAGTVLAPDTVYYLFYDDAARAGGAVSWQATTDPAEAQTSESNPARHYGGAWRTAAPPPPPAA